MPAVGSSASRVRLSWTSRGQSSGGAAGDSSGPCAGQRLALGECGWSRGCSRRRCGLSSSTSRERRQQPQLQPQTQPEILVAAGGASSVLGGDVGESRELARGSEQLGIPRFPLLLAGRRCRVSRIVTPVAVFVL